ncbi:hypothetical protein BGY98DRAFT_206611 [Russula aff. rugulosa BPL654]|nr:hypothetical protein BGY98DRAFT_206611 [Russula aff. rugulosa BPL654]
MLLIFFLFFSTFCCIRCDFHLSARVPQVVCVTLFFFPFIYSRCCTFAPHKANKFIYPSLPIFFVYLFCLPENLLGLSACQSKGEAGSHTQSHKFSHIFRFVPPSTWRPFLSPVSIVPCSRSIALLLIDPDV